MDEKKTKTNMEISIKGEEKKETSGKQLQVSLRRPMTIQYNPIRGYYGTSYSGVRVGELAIDHSYWMISSSS